MDAVSGQMKYRTDLLQDRREWNDFLAVLRGEGVRSYLEIGSMYGGSLWSMAMSIIPHGGRLVSVDLAVDTPAARPSLEQCVAELCSIGFDAHLIDGDSAAPATVEKARAVGPFDCVFIDGAHTLDAVTADWTNYGPLGRIVAFHDISWNETWKSAVPGRNPPPMGVPKLWQSLKPQYRHLEIRLRQPSNYYGIGVLWR